ncbi:MAG: dienelactone hydrolase family protein, partial [Clostridia bacterium]|nr:dienelactone hydrolase family protein [Clostridia bacterium]
MRKFLCIAWILCFLVFFGNWNLCFVATEGSPTVIGDIDQDGSVHASDLVLLKRCLLGIMESTEAMDVNADENVDIRDLVHLKKIVSAQSPSTWTENVFTSDSIRLSYLLYTPEDATAKMPLIVYLHGGSGKGNDLGLLTAGDGFPLYLKSGRLGSVPAYVVMPQLSESYMGWNDIADSLINLISEISECYDINRNRISLTGHSMGGTGTWGIAAAYPATFSRIAPCSGSINNTTLNVNKIKNIPVRAFVGSADTIVSPDSSISFINSLKEAGGDAEITIFDGAGHFDVPALVYLNSNIDIINWLISVPCSHANITSISEILSTCSEQGWYEYSQCNDCGQLFDESGNKISEIPYRPLLSHTAAEPVRENEVAATCSITGSYDEVVYCSVCHEEVSREQKTIPIDEDAHDWEEWVQTKAPTETEPG